MTEKPFTRTIKKAKDMTRHNTPSHHPTTTDNAPRLLSRHTLMCLLLAACAASPLGHATQVCAQSDTPRIGAQNMEEFNVAKPALKDSIADAEEQQYTGPIYNVVEQMPSFPGGNAALMKFIFTNLQYPEEAKKNGLQGRVVVELVVEPDGCITNVRIGPFSHAGKSLCDEAIRVVKSMPRWNPGQHGGKAVRVRFRVPVSFRIP